MTEPKKITEKKTQAQDKMKRVRLIQRQPNRPRRAVSSGRKGKA